WVDRAVQRVDDGIRPWVDVAAIVDAVPVRRRGWDLPLVQLATVERVVPHADAAEEARPLCLVLPIGSARRGDDVRGADHAEPLPVVGDDDRDLVRGALARPEVQLHALTVAPAH